MKYLYMYLYLTVYQNKHTICQPLLHTSLFPLAAEVPAGFRLQYVHGFVEELVVNDDPEYQWIDKIRTPRSSNEARQRLFSKMSGKDSMNGCVYYCCLHNIYIYTLSQ